MSDPHIFIVRLWAETPPTPGFRGSVREVQTEETTTVQTPEQLSASMLSALQLPGVPAATAPVRDRRPWLAIAAGTALVIGGSWLSAGSQALPGVTVLPFVLLALTGLCSGFLSGLLGIGGALVVVPAMYLLLPLLGIGAERLPHVAVGTSLLAMLPTALAATLAQYRARGIETAWLARLAPGMVIGAGVGALFAMQLRGTTLSLLFAAQSIYYGWGLMRNVRPLPTSFRSRLICGCLRAPGWFASPLIAAFCSCAGMGAGSLIAPYLMSKGVTLLRATATSCPLNLCIAVGGGLVLNLSELWASAPDAAPSASWPAAAVVGACAVMTVRQGVALAHRLPVDLFRKTLGWVTLLGSGVLILRTAWVCL